MVETRGNRPSFDGTSELPSFVDDRDLGKLLVSRLTSAVGDSCHPVCDRQFIPLALTPHIC